MPQYAIAHLGSSLRGVSRTSGGFVMVEGVHQREALIEITLDQWIGSGYGMMQMAEADEQRRSIVIAGRRVVIVLLPQRDSHCHDPYGGGGFEHL